MSTPTRRETQPLAVILAGTGVALLFEILRDASGFEARESMVSLATTFATTLALVLSGRSVERR